MKVYCNPARSQWPVLRKRPTDNVDNLMELAKNVFERVAEYGDSALREYTAQFDTVDITNIRLGRAAIKRQAERLSPSVRRAIDQAYDNIQAFHAVQRVEDVPVTIQPGVVCWQEVRPIERVGLYVPGGTAPLVSTALMLGIPAVLAGCRQIVMATPPGKDGMISPAICYAALKVGVTELLRVGGMQAIAAMTVGTKSVPAVDKLFGPGNQYVTAAKQYATRYGVAIDIPAGPSEVLVVADERANPRYVAADLLSQAEHGPDSQVVLVTTDALMASKVQKELERQLVTLPRKFIAEQALENSFCAVFDAMKSAIDFANAYAPEHIILSVAGSKRISRRVMNAGSVFVGNYSPESAGDYASGTNHTLPTNGWARSYSGLSLGSFTKKLTFQKLTKAGLSGIAETIETLAIAEGLDAHARAVRIRFDKKETRR